MNPIGHIVAQVTLAFFDRYVLSQARALTAMTRDGNVHRTAALAANGQPPP